MHEIGVHMMRGLTGADTDMPPLAIGLSEYYDNEEGTGKVFEQAIGGKFTDSGVPYYIITGLMQQDKKDFRGAFEFMWRFNVLKKAKNGMEISDSLIKKQRLAAYESVMRIGRGTDGAVAWSKDLAYYNGSMRVWRYFEDNGVDDITLMSAILLGKGDIEMPSHRRVMLESRSKDDGISEDGWHNLPSGGPAGPSVNVRYFPDGTPELSVH